MDHSEAAGFVKAISPKVAVPMHYAHVVGQPGDAELFRAPNINYIRTSHYPPAEEFLDACDELGLMVWEEIPGWQYIGDDAWKDLLVRDTRDMIIRDRNRPSIVIWGTRVNESDNDVELYRRTKAVAKSLDDTRPTSGSMTPSSRKNWQRDWHVDVFAFDDYHAAPDHTVGIDEPVPGFPYMLAEAVGQFNYTTGKYFNSYYRRTNDPATQSFQALRHAQAHSKATANPRNCGVVAWCGFEYGSLVNAYQRVKYPGVVDIFRVPKLGASFYLAQCDPKTRPVIAPVNWIEIFQAAYGSVITERARLSQTAPMQQTVTSFASAIKVWC